MLTVDWQSFNTVFPPILPSYVCQVSPIYSSNPLFITVQNVREIRNTNDQEKELYNGALGVIFTDAPSNGNWQYLYTKESGDFIYQQFQPN
jgi:hypothetical protein